MKIVIIGFIAIFCVSCTTMVPVRYDQIVYSDGINQLEAEAIGENFTEKNKFPDCEDFHVVEAIDKDPNWQVQLGCSKWGEYASKVYLKQKIIGSITISKKTGKTIAP